MVIISPTVKTDKLKLKKLLNFLRTWVDHPNNRLPFALSLPVDKEEIRKDLDIIKYQEVLARFFVLSSFFTLEVHLTNQLDTVFGLIRTAGSKCKYGVSKIRHVVAHITFICVIKSLVDEVNARFGVREVFKVQCFPNGRSNGFLILKTIEIDHLLFSFHR